MRNLSYRQLILSLGVSLTLLMLDLMRSFSADTLHASFGEKFLSYTPDSRHFSEEFPDTPHASNSGEFLLLTHLMLVLVR